MPFKIKFFTVILALIVGDSVLDSAERIQAAKNTKPITKEIKVSIENVNLFVRTAGDLSSDNVLIAINGGPGQSSRYMRDLERLAGAAFAVVTYDQRGTGQSTDPFNGGYGLAGYISDVEAIRQAVGAEKVHLLGHSWGGILAMRYAAVFPQNVSSIILMASGPPIREAVEAGQTQLNKRIAMLQDQGVIPKTRPENDKNLIELILPAYFSDPDFPMPVGLKNTDFNAVAYQQTMEALGDWDLSADAAKLTLPVLLLWGEDDPFGLPMAMATKDALSSAEVEFVLLKGCGHYWHECANVFFTHVRDFLNLPSSPSGRE